MVNKQDMRKALVEELEATTEDLHDVINVLLMFHDAGLDRQSLEDGLKEVGYTSLQISEYMYELGRIS